ncbi:MAG: CAP domain-containing protein [Myxococcota bacterium]
MKTNARRSLTALWMTTLLYVGCGEALVTPSAAADDVSAGEFETRAQALLGVPERSYPSYNERVVLYQTNRSRTEPEKYNPSMPFPPSPPLRYDRELSEAARFHADRISVDGCWCQDHSSCCQLEGMGESTQCATASTGCGVETASQRVARFSPYYSGENAAQGMPTPAEAVEGWIHSLGHWENFNGAHTKLGVGENFAGSTKSWVQDFGIGGLPPVFGDGIHMPRQSSVDFGITYFQPNSGGPQDIMVIVDGQCHDLQLHSGTAELGAFQATVAAPACARYYFYVRDGNGVDHTYPQRGSFAVTSTPDGACPFYSEDRPADTCSPAGQSCETGESRACYTGRFETRNVGMCAEGTERCIGGVWQGTCRNEVKPEAADACGDGVDNDCDGVVDNGCSGARGEGADLLDPDAEDEVDGDDGCSSSGAHGAPGGMGWLVVVMWTLWGLRSRRDRRPPRLDEDERKRSP